MAQITVGTSGDYQTIQDAIDNASEGDTIVISAGLYEEAVIIDKGLSLVAQGEVTIDPLAGTGITLSGDIGGGDVRLEGLAIIGGNKGIAVAETANAGKLTVVDCAISGNSKYGIYVTGDDPDDDGSAPIVSGITAIEVINSTFANNGFDTGSNGSAHIKLFGFSGDALFQDIEITGADAGTDTADRPDYGIEITGYVDGGNSNPVGDGAPDIGTVVFDNVVVSGAFHKNAVALTNFTEVDGLTIGGSNGGLDLSGAESAWGPVFNLDSTEDTVVDASGFDISFPVGSNLPADGIVTEIQGDSDNQDEVGQTITGTSSNDAIMGKGGDDTLYGGDGNDILYGADKPGGSRDDDAGADALYGGEGNDVLLGGDGDDTLDGGANADTLDGGDGTDTAVYAATLTLANITSVADVDHDTVGDQAGWQVSTGTEGTDLLTNVEVIDHGGASNILLVGSGGFATIQEAIDAASAGDTILIAAGTYNETLDINTDGLTLIGQGIVEINGTFSEDNTDYATSGKSLAEWLKSAASYDSGSNPGVKIAADDVTLENLTIKDSGWGIELADGADGTTMTEVALTSNMYGIYKQANSAITDLDINGGSISDGYIGISFDKALGGGDANGVSIIGTHFEDLLRKGIYVETLSNANLQSITMENVGQWGSIGPNNGGVSGAGGNGINLNLKYGSYSNIEISFFTLNNVGASDREGLDLAGHKNGGAIVIEARDDGGYSSNPATLTNIEIHNGTISGTTSTAIHVGEPGQDNAGPTVTVNNVAITATADHDANHGDIANESQSRMTVTGTAGDDMMIASGNSDGAFTLNGGFGDDILGGGSANDALNGGFGLDTAVYAGSVATGDVSYNGSTWVVDAGAEGVDNLTGIERISHGGVGDILLVGGGGFTNRAAAEAQGGPSDILLFASTPGAVTDTDGAANAVDEQAATGTVVGIDAQASTDSAGGFITYSLIDNAGGRFTINATTGEVRVANGGLIDFETAASLQIVVRATNDLGSFTDQAFTIAVNDIPAVVTTGTDGKDVFVGTVEPDDISGGKKKDKVYGEGGDDTLDGNGGKDKLFGGDGDDTLNGGHGKDKIVGGEGIDTATYATSPDGVKIKLNKTKQKGGDAQGDKLKSIENVTGSDHNDKIVGDGGNNVLDGAGGNDFLNGKEGNDVLIGGTGNDTFKYKTGFGIDTILDLGIGSDVVELGVKGVDSYKELKALMTESGGNVVIDFGKGDMLVLANKTIDSLSKADFDF